MSWVSIPVGVVSLAERYGGRRIPASRYPEMRARIEKAFCGLAAKFGNGRFDLARHHLIGTSGTLTTLAGINFGLARYNRARVDGQWLVRDDILRISDTITSRDFQERAAIPCVGTDRADLILPGCAIMSVIMEKWPCEHLRVADRGLREGLLIGLLREAKAERAAATPSA